MPRMLRGIVEDVVRFEPDMELVGRGDSRDLTMAIASELPDVVIVALDGFRRTRRYKLLLDNPRLKVVVLSDDGQQAHLFDFRQMPLPDVSPQALVNVIRAAVDSERAET